MFKPTNKTLVTAITFLLIGIIGTSVVWVYAQPSTPFTISEGKYPSVPSTTISIEGSTYYAKNDYGQITYSGTNASLVSLNAFNDGGHIHYKGGQFILDTTLEVPSQVTLITGEKWRGLSGLDAGTWLIGAMGQTNDIISRIGLPTEYEAYGLTIRDIGLYGHYGGDFNSRDGIHIANTSLVKIDNVYVRSVGRYGIYMYEVLQHSSISDSSFMFSFGGTQGYFVGCDGLEVTGSSFSNAYNSSVWVQSMTSASFTNNFFHSWGGDGHFDFQAYDMYSSTLQNNYFEGESEFQLVLDGSDSGKGHSNTIIGNYFNPRVAGNQVIIKIRGATSKNTISYSMILNQAEPNVIAVNVTTGILRNDVFFMNDWGGFPTELIGGEIEVLAGGEWGDFNVDYAFLRIPVYNDETWLSGWDYDEVGIMWFNNATGHFRGWNGTHTVDLD